MAKVHNIMNTKNAEEIAAEIVDIFKTQANSENVEYEFTIKEKTGQISSNVANTFFYFDTIPNSALDEFKKSLFAEDLEDIKEGSKEEEDLITNINIFLQKVCKIISSNYKKDIQNIIREVVLGNKADAESIPLDKIDILSIDIADFSSVPEAHKYLLKIQKKEGTEIDVDEITVFVQNKEEKGQNIQDTLSMEKLAGNPIFENVKTIEKGRKFLNEISLFIFVDYSFNSDLPTENIVDASI